MRVRRRLRCCSICCSSAGHRGRRQHGFTLLEVLLALAVIAVALVAVLRATGQQVIAADVIEEQTMAHWVASNVVTELRLRQPWPALGRSNGRTRMGQHDWFWEIEVTDTDVEGIRRLQASVFLDPARQQGVAELAAFVGR